MKKTLLSILIFVFVSTTYAFMPSHINDFTIGRIDQIEQNNDGIKLNFDNFIYYKITDKLRIFQERNTFINEMITITDIPNNLSLKKGDIIAIDSSWSGKSSGVLKVTCEEGMIKIEGSKNKYFGTFPSTSDPELIKNFKGNDYKLAQKLDDVIGCDNLDSFLNKDRRFEDLHGNNLNVYFYSILGFFVFILGITVFFLFRKN